MKCRLKFEFLAYGCPQKSFIEEKTTSENHLTQGHRIRDWKVGLKPDSVNFSSAPHCDIDIWTGSHEWPGLDGEWGAS